MRANASSPAAALGTIFRPKHFGRGALHLEAAPVRTGDWLSGVVEVPERFLGTGIRLYVECVHTSYRRHGTGPASMGRSFRWYTVELLDGARLERQAGKVLVPFAVRLPADSPPTSDDTLNKQRVDWILRVQAIRPGARYKLLSFRSLVLRTANALSWVPLTVARLALGWVFVQSGWGKLHNLPQVVEYFTHLGIPAPHLQAPFVAGVELAGGLLLLGGLFTRVVSVPLAMTMLVALLTAKRADIATAGDLYGTVEFLYLLAFGTLAAFGAGVLSLDEILVRRFAAAPELSG
jgi:putative oxidoreductase